MENDEDILLFFLGRNFVSSLECTEWAVKMHTVFLAITLCTL